MNLHPPTAERFETNRQVGEAYNLPLDHELVVNEFSVRAFELAAIERWARNSNVRLRNEFCVDVRRERGFPVKAKVMTYDHIPLPARCQPVPVFERKLMTEERPLNSRCFYR